MLRKTPAALPLPHTRLRRASMRPQRNAAENALSDQPTQREPRRFNEAAA